MIAAAILSRLWSGYALPTPRQNCESPAFSKPRQKSTLFSRGAVQKRKASSLTSGSDAVWRS